MYFTKTVLYLVAIGLAGIASLVFLGFAATKPKAKRFISRKWSLMLGIVLLVFTIYTGVNLAGRTYQKIKKTYLTLKNFPELTESSNNNDTTNYVRTLKEYEPVKYKGKVPDSYYTYYGYRDWWRFPVVYPYSITCIDAMDYGTLTNDSGRTNFEEGNPAINATPQFTKFTFDANCFAAEEYYSQGEKSPEKPFFIREFKNGTIIRFKDEESLNKNLKERNFNGEKKMISIRKYSERF
jgi:hypothetical protein